MQITGKVRSKIQSIAAVMAIMFTFGTVAHASVMPSPSAINFGTEAVGSSSASHTVTITNDNRKWRVTISSISVSAAQFSYSGPSLPVVLEPGDSFTGSVTFKPSAAQAYSGTLIFTRANGWTIPIALSGTGQTTTTPTPETIGPIPGLSFTGAAASAIAGRSFTVSNTSPISPTFTATPDQPWLSVSQSTSTAAPGNAVLVAVKTAGLAAGTYTGHVIVTIPNQGGYTWTNSPYSVPVTLTIPSTSAVAPTISSQPASAKITVGQAATFNVAATGTAPMTYQWKKNGAPIIGAISSTYTTPAVTTADNNAQFSAVVSNSAGAANSNAAILTVTTTTAAPTITTQPASQTVIAGKTASFTVAASGTAPLMYQWSKNGTPISGAISSTYTTPAETSGDNNAQFTATVSNGAGSVTSNAATLTVSASSLLLNSSSSSLSFGNVDVSSNSAKTVTLTNAGNSSITISNVTVSGAGFNATGVSSGLILTPGQTATLTATFAPAATGAVTGKVSVASNATNSPDSISLSGTGITVVNHSVALSWSPSSSNTVVGYNAYSSAKSGGPYTKITSAPVAATSYTDASVQSGLTYYFVVTSVDSSNVESAYSGEVSALVP